VAGEARTQALDAMRSAQDELRGHASQQTDRAAQGLHGLAGQIQALVEGRTDEAGVAGDYARQAGDKVRQVAGRLEDGGFEGVVDDVRRFAQRRPGLFLIGAAAAGFAAGRMIRASRGGEDQDDFGGSAATSRMAGDAGQPHAGYVDPAGMGYPPEYGLRDAAPSGYVPAVPVAPLAEGDALVTGDLTSRAAGGGFDTGSR
jgi:hypothetical protein